MTDPLFIIVDLFCGAGGTTTGFVQAALDGNSLAKVIACVNHDAKAIKSHWRNHPDVKHFEEDIRTLDLKELVSLVNYYRKLYPNALLILWASLECTNFSKAKGGQPRDADSRTLADHLDRYVIALSPDYVQIENVVEFMSWGPLDDKGKPVSRKNGQDWMRWRKMICGHGYTDSWQELNSANYGAYTSRNRLFGVFAKEGLPIAFPIPTHAKVPSKLSMYGDLLKWNPVKHMLDFADEGESIFTRKKPLSDKTLERIYAGLIKYVAKGDTAFISKYFSGRPKGKVNSVDDPCPTNTTFGGNSLVQTKNFSDLPVSSPAGAITTKDHHALVQPKFLAHYYGSGGQLSSIENPAPVIPTKARTAIISPEFLTIYNGKSLHRSVDEPSPVIPTNDRLSLIQPEFLVNYNHSSETNDINQPAPTLVTRDKLAKVKPEYFIDKHFGSTAQNQSIHQPAGSIMPTDKHRLVEAVPFLVDPQWSTRNGNPAKSVDEPAPTLTANRHHYLVNPAWGGNPGSVDEPCCVIVARQDKAPLYFVQVEKGPVQIAIYEADSDICIKIKEFMVIYELIDIKMRMLRVHELLKIQGFPANYQLEGNQSDQKKFIGNSVVPHIVKAWTEAMAIRIINDRTTKVA
jgi:DNA (cytosine-5)-methyltransferase 1